MKFIVDENNINLRLDNYISSNSDYSRTYTSTLISDGYVSVNGEKITKASYKTKLNDEIFVEDKEPEVIVENGDIPEAIEKISN